VCLFFRPVFRPALSSALCVWLTLGGTGVASAAQSGGLRVNVVQGEGQSLVIGSGTLKDVVVEVVDASGKAVPNANVFFSFGSGGTTVDGLSSFVTSSDAQGHATARVRPTGQTGGWSIHVTASYQQQSASASVAMTNVTEAPKAVAVSPAATSAPGDMSSAPPSPSSSSTSSAAPKKSNKTLLIVILVAAGAAGGAAAALGHKGSSSPTDTTATSSAVSISIGANGTGSFPIPGVH